MRVPQISERVKEAPAQALRGVFAGIGQLLLVTDKLRNKTPAGAGVPRTRAPEASQPTTTEAPAAAEATTAPEPTAESSPVADSPPAAAVTPDVVVAEVVVAEASVAEEPVAVAAVVAEPTAAEPVPAKAAPAKATRTTARKSATKPPARDFDKTGNVRLLAGQEDAEAAASDVPAVPTATTPLPLPNYDELSIASLRARLRNLDIPRLKQVADYERSHAGRAEVIAMFERRVAKLEAEPEAGA
jgi:hypothetical protein